MILSAKINKSEFASANKETRKTKTAASFLASLIFSFMILTSVASAQVIDIENFGSGSYPGPALQGNQTTYTYNAPAQPANYPNILMDGQYVIATDTQQGFSNWSSIGDHTTGSGYMMLINADNNQSGEFYRAQIPLTANTSFDFVTYLVTANSQGDYDYCTNNEGGLVLPNVTMQIEDGSGGVIASLDTGPIPFNPTPEWGEYQITFATDAVTTSVELVLINNSVGGCGNDLAIDDITFQVAVTMEAFDDSITLTNTDVAQAAVLTLGGNDNLDGSPLPGTELYYVAAGSSLPSGISLDGATGDVGVAAGTPEGTYTFDYEVCETTNKYNCSIATATIIVAFPKLPVTAVDDTGSVADSSFGVASVLNVLDNDSIDSVTSPTDFDLSISAGSSLPSALTFDVNTGEVGVLPGAPTGLYSFDYDICEDGDPTNCETATVTIDVTNPNSGGFCPAGTAAIPGTYYVTSATGGQNANRAAGLPLAEGTSETGNNSAITYFGPVTMDLTGDPTILAAEGDIIEISLSSAWGNQARAEILMSADGVTYTSLGTTGNGGSVYGAWTSNIMRYDDFAVPAGGARYVQVLQENQGVRVDGVTYATQCQETAQTDVDLVTVKTLTSATATPNEGDTVTFEIEVSNNGVGDATGVSLTDLIPAGLTATGVNGTVSSGSYDAGTGVWTLGALADGASATLTIEGTVNTGQGGNAITNALAAPAAGDQTDPTTDGDDLTESVTVVSIVSSPAFPVGSGLSASVCNAVPATSPYQNYGIRWDHALNSGTSGEALIVNTDTFASATEATYVGIDAQVDSYNVNIDADTIPSAYSANAYMEYQFTTENFDNLAEIRGIANTLYGTGDPSHYLATGSYRYAIAMDDDAAFGSPQVLMSDVTVDGIDTSGATVAITPVDNGNYLRSFAHWDPSGTTINLLPNTTYMVRIYLYSVYETGLDRSQSYPNVTLWDDFMLKSISCDYTITAPAESFPVFATSGGVTTTVLASDELNGAAVDPADVTLTVGDALDSNGDPSTALSLNPATGLITVEPNTSPGDYTVEYTICEDATPNNCATITETVTIEANPSLSITKVADNPGPYTAGDVVTYTYTVVNDGDQIVRDIAISDTHNGSDPAPIPGNETLLTDAAPTGDSTDAGIDNSWDVLAPGDMVVFTGTYTITAIDAANL